MSNDKGHEKNLPTPYKWKRVMSGFEIELLLKENGWVFERQNGTSHKIYKKNGISCPIPDHKEIAKGTLGNIKRIVKHAETIK